ncbi:MAG: radical SAM protein [Thermodesulfobacteriota bacterium]
MVDALNFEQGPIRPPSEAGSLLIRVTRNCPWNRCVFCSTYKGKKFSRRGLDEIKADIDAAKAVFDEIKAISFTLGEAGKITPRVLSAVAHDTSLPMAFQSIGLWAASGGTTVFLQDANSLMLSTEALLDILGYLRDRFPRVDRITSYARAATLQTKTVRDYERLRGAGLSRLHVGMESGSDRILKLIDKGARSEQLIEGGRRVVQGGISLCLYVIPGIGGIALSDENAMESARVVNAINPSFMRFRSLFVRPRTALAEKVKAGEFEPPSEDAMVSEIRKMVNALDGISTSLVSDHILNLLEEVEGTLPDDKARMLDVIDRYLSLPDEERLLFQLGRRGGGLRSVSDLSHPVIRSRLEAAKRQIEQELPGGILEYLEAIKLRFI